MSVIDQSICCSLVAVRHVESWRVDKDDDYVKE